jgi:hypothetical protein
MATTESVSVNGRFGPLDDLVRRKLMVSDAKSADEIKEALLNQYPLEKSRIQLEATGMPVVADLCATPVLTATISSTEEELSQAKSNLEQDLKEVIREAALRNISANLEGLGGSLMNAVGEGVSAARAASDAGQRDKVFSIRRILSEYARLTRCVGTLVRGCIGNCRRLARNIDWIASIMLILSGEAIAKNALKGFLIQIPLGEMEARREAALNALKNLLGTNAAGFDDETWGYRTDGLINIYQEIDLNNQGELKLLFQESELDRMLSELVEQIARDNKLGVTGFGPAANATIEKMEHLQMLFQNLPGYWPPLRAFMNELDLIVQIVDSRNIRAGMRLIDLARSPITFYGSRYGNLQTPDLQARGRLSRIALNRSQLADNIDRHAANIVNNHLDELDRLTSCVDRVVDLYSLGTEDWGAKENRAYFYYQEIRNYLSANPIIHNTIIANLIDVNNNINILGPIDQAALDLERDSYGISERRYQQMLNLVIPNGLI